MYLQIHMINNVDDGTTSFTRSYQVPTRQHLCSNKMLHGRHAWTILCILKRPLTNLKHG